MIKTFISLSYFWSSKESKQLAVFGMHSPSEYPEIIHKEEGKCFTL